MTNQTDTCRGCQHEPHTTGTECETPVRHGPNHFHLYLCLNRLGADRSCPPQMSCQGGTLGYSDVYHLQHGRTLAGADAAVSSVGQAPATDQTDLRDRIASAIEDAPYRPGTRRSLQLADAVLAVLSATTDQPAAPVCKDAEGCHRVVACDPGCGARDLLAEATRPLPAPVDRAAVLREAADIAEAQRQFEPAYGARKSAQISENVGILRVAAELRRMADETQPAETDDLRTALARIERLALTFEVAGNEFIAKQIRAAVGAQPAETEAHPAEHSWAAELYDPLADEWVPGTRYADRDRAVNHLEHAAKIGPLWKDGAPTQRRLVRATTTYTVEQPAAGARQDGAPS